MPKIKTNKTKFPEGWSEIEPTLEEFNQKMRDGKKKKNRIIIFLFSFFFF